MNNPDNGKKQQHPDREHVDTWRKAVLAAPDLTPGQKIVGMAYSFHFNYDHTNKWYRSAWASAATLAPEVNMKPETVEKALRALRTKGYLKSSGRTTGGFGAHINKFTVPKNECMTRHDEGEEQQTPPHEDAGPPAPPCGTPPHEDAGDSLSYSLNNSLKSPLDGHSQANEPMDITYFIEVEEKQRRDEFINYWSTVAMKYDNHHDYLTVLAIFSSNEDMADERRTDWGATFMHFMANMAGATPTEGSDMKVENAVTDLDSTDEPTTGHENLMKVWQGRADDEGAFRKAWEHLIAGGHEPIHVLAVGASEHVGNKYPRELGDVLTTLPKIKRVRAVAAYQRNIHGRG